MSDWLGTKETARLLGVGATTLRRWADEGKLVHRRTAGGHRRFSRSSVENLQRNGVDSIAREPELRSWVDSVLIEDVHRCYQRLDVLRSQCDDWFEVADFLGKVSAEIGELWADGQLSIIEEHIVSSRMHQAAQTVSCSFDVDDNAPVGFLTTIAEEHHSLALSLLQLCMRSVNINAVLPGANMPVAELLQHIKQSNLRTHIIAISASRWSSDPITLARAYAEIAEACRERGIHLIVGGEGRWPDAVEYGYRCRSFHDLRLVLESTGYLDK